MESSKISEEDKNAWKINVWKFINCLEKCPKER
jgi:hypothetical protein